MWSAEKAVLIGAGSIHVIPLSMLTCKGVRDAYGASSWRTQYAPLPLGAANAYSASRPTGPLGSRCPIYIVGYSGWASATPLHVDAHHSLGHTLYVPPIVTRIDCPSEIATVPRT